MNYLRTGLKGALMGIAEVIPGVSGGTIAFITGIYERLINAIKSFNPSLLGEFKNNGIKGVWKAIDGAFLLNLLIGMIGGVGIGVVLITFLLAHYPEPLWAFFFGLIIASSIYIGRQVGQWNGINIGLLVLGFIIAFGITTLAPTEGSTNPLFLFGAGAIAISALILPGISGSFMLLLMGMYTIVISSLKNLAVSPTLNEFKILLFFGLGALLGLAVFSRVLSYTFKNYKNQTLALLTGFMIGSLNKIWPWRNPELIMDKESQERISANVIEVLKTSSDREFKILQESNVFPSEYLNGEPQILLVIVAAIVGFMAVFFLSKLDKSSQ